MIIGLYPYRYIYNIWIWWRYICALWCVYNNIFFDHTLCKYMIMNILLMFYIHIDMPTVRMAPTVYTYIIKSWIIMIWSPSMVCRRELEPRSIGESVLIHALVLNRESGTVTAAEDQLSLWLFDISIRQLYSTQFAVYLRMCLRVCLGGVPKGACSGVLGCARVC